MLIGSALGVITAAMMQMITTAKRRAPASYCGVTTPTNWRKTTTIGNWKPAPKATIM